MENKDYSAKFIYAFYMHQGPGRGLGRDGGRGPGGNPNSAENRKRTSADARLNEGSPAKGLQANPPPLMLEWKSEGGVGFAAEKEVQQKLVFEGEIGRAHV